MTTQQRWATGRPLLNILPGINGQYSSNEVADWVTKPWDNLFIDTKGKIENLPNQLNPEVCDEEWLDYIAGFCGFTGEYWDKNWPVAAKRALLKESFNLIWPKKGSLGVLSYVLTAFDILHIIQEGNSFIIGVDEVGEPLGLIAWDYDILLPTQYYGTPTADLTSRLDSLFGPCWCTKEIIYDNTFFRDLEVLGFPGGTTGFNLFSPDTDSEEAISA